MAEESEGILQRFDFGEWLVDLLAGILLLALFGPFVYALRYGFSGFSGIDGDPVIGIFPKFIKMIAQQHLGTFTPWLLLGLAMVLGTASRGVLILYHIFPPAMWLEKLIAKIAVHQVSKWHPLSTTPQGMQEITHSLIDVNPFHKIGSGTYAAFRADLLDRQVNGSQKIYWSYEMALYLRSSHYYYLAYTFFWTYLTYGAYFYLYSVACGHHLNWRQPLPWLSILLLVFLTLIGLFEEVLIHGTSFITIDNELYKKWTDATSHPDSQAKPSLPTDSEVGSHD